MDSHLDEKQRRLLAGAMARLLGRGGPTVVARASGMSRNTVLSGVKSVDAGGRADGAGAGRGRAADRS